MGRAQSAAAFIQRKYAAGGPPMKVLFAVVAVCAAVVIAFEADDPAREVAELSQNDLSLPDHPANIVMLQDASGSVTVTDDALGNTGNATVEADSAKAKADTIESAAD